MGYENDRGLGLPGPQALFKADQFILHLSADEWIQAAERLVHEEDLRLQCESACQTNPLQHAAAEFDGVVALPTLETDKVKFLLRALVADPPSDTLYLEPPRGVLKDTEVGEQCVMLKHHCDAVSSKLSQVIICYFGEIVPEYIDLTGRRNNQTIQTTYQCRFS